MTSLTSAINKIIHGNVLTTNDYMTKKTTKATKATKTTKVEVTEERTNVKVDVAPNGELSTHEEPVGHGVTPNPEDAQRQAVQAARETAAEQKRQEAL